MNNYSFVPSRYNYTPEKSSLFILENKIPVPTQNALEWSIWTGKEDNVRVALTIINKIEISTIFLGYNVSINSDKPILFETIAFNFDIGGGTYCNRYYTWDEAIAGHEKTVELVKSKIAEQDNK